MDRRHSSQPMGDVARYLGYSERPHSPVTIRVSWTRFARRLTRSFSETCERWRSERNGVIRVSRAIP